MINSIYKEFNNSIGPTALSNKALSGETTILVPGNPSGNLKISKNPKTTALYEHQ